MFLFREALPKDEDSILALAEHLNTLNLPPERPFIRALLERSQRSFGGSDAFDPSRGFLFVLESSDGTVVGTSMIHAQHGTFHEPHVFFRVVDEECFAELALPDGELREVHMLHKMLHLGRTYQGPSELGGLVLHPDLRGHPEKLGRLLSLGRLAYVASHRRRFRDRMLAELLPPLEEGHSGTTSPLWDALGRKFTQLDYGSADALSRHDKEFIWRLFPRNPVHASLLPRSVQDIIGEVGPASLGAKRMLERSGFVYTGNVDPFDGGPHFEAVTDEIPQVRDRQTFAVEPVAVPGPDLRGAPRCLVSASMPHVEPPRFKAVRTRLHVEKVEKVAYISAEAHARLGAPARVSASLR